MSVVSADIKPLAIVFADDGLVPNNPMPFLVYKRAIDVDNDQPEKTIEGVFSANGWGAMWRNGVYDYLHYHATVHEVLGVARGNAIVRFGGDGGTEIAVAAGDVAGPARRHRASMPVVKPRFFRGRRLSARTENADYAADGGKLSQGAADDTGGRAAQDRSSARIAGRACETMEARLTALAMGGLHPR